MSGILHEFRASEILDMLGARLIDVMWTHRKGEEPRMNQERLREWEKKYRAFDRYVGIRN